MTPKGKARLYVDCELSLNIELELNKDQAHYLSRVMRCSLGDLIDVFNGRNGEWQCKISQISKSNVRLVPYQQVKQQTTTKGPSLAFAPIKKARTDFIVEKATELGVSTLCPVFTANTDTNRVKVDRLQMIAIEAAEQCRRLDIPEVKAPTHLQKFLENYPSGHLLFVLDETGTAQPLPDVINPKNSIKNICFLIGPEGGFQSSELDALRKLPFATMVGVGPRILRAETAVVAALSCWQATTGAWKNN
ncbi:MAG: 16S rRNA (uracil(1498)-N(3))-methyltransferase [Proteobacteria bacterium]|jgi:16S rRNA (uracil1498-N3)-methyltransferase|nr:16S rRNA (uracil(1498)-N(3))-methyltransferase [Pseudomonadota bacterium]